MTKKGLHDYYKYVDNKKTNLTPELKEIYDRVMNTSSGTPIQQSPPQQPPNIPTTPPLSTTQTQPLQSSMPQIPDPIGFGQPNPTQQAPGMQQAPQMPSPSAPLPQSAPTSSTGIPSAVQGKKKSKISMPILIVLGVVFISAWIVLWTIVFGFVKLP